jgi:hypothetical protein
MMVRILQKFVIIKITCKHSELIDQANQITAFHLVDIPLVLQNMVSFHH